MQMGDQSQSTDVFHASPQTKSLHSSTSLGWQGIIVEQHYFPAGEYTIRSSPAHLVSLYQGASTRVEHTYNQQTFTNIMDHSSIQIVPAGTENSWRHEDGVQLLCLFLTPELLQQVTGNQQQQQFELLPQFQPQDRRIEHIGAALLAEVLEGGTTGHLYVEGLATALAAHLIHTYSGTPRPLSQESKLLPAFLLRKITSFIDARLAEDLNIAELASEAGLSPSHFSSLFQQTTGLSPHRYIVQRRLERARHLLTSTNLSVGEIATTVGFYDQSHLVRHLQRSAGVTPTYIRKHLS